MASGAAALLTLTGVGAPIGLALEVVAAGASAVSTVNRVRRGDGVLDVALSALGAVTGAASGVATLVAKNVVNTARAAGTLTRMTGSVARGVKNGLEVYGVLSYTPLALTGAARSLWCEGVI